MATLNNLSDNQKHSVIKSLPPALVLALHGDMIVEYAVKQWLSQQDTRSTKKPRKATKRMLKGRTGDT